MEASEYVQTGALVDTHYQIGHTYHTRNRSSPVGMTEYNNIDRHVF